MKTYGELKSDFQINEAAGGGDEEGEDSEGGVEFEEADIDDICESTFVIHHLDNPRVSGVPSLWPC